MRTQYLQNPCETFATAYWKEQWFLKPKGIIIRLEKDSTVCETVSGKGTRYFRLIHYLNEFRQAVLPENYSFRNVVLPNEAELVASLINGCYDGSSQTKDNVLQWAAYPVFNNELWVFVWDNIKDVPAALGIADFDADINEGSLEWIQVLPSYRRNGLGEMIVLELLSRLKEKADFVTVSGEIDNVTNPQQLYRRCGFVGDTVWVIQRE